MAKGSCEVVSKLGTADGNMLLCRIPSNRYLTGYACCVLSSSSCKWVVLQKNVFMLTPPCEALTLTSGRANFKTAQAVLFLQSCSNIQPRDNRSYEINWMSDQDMQVAQSKFCCGACGGREMRAALSGTLYGYVCQHFCLWTLTFFQHASFAFVLIISFSHLASPESKKCTFPIPFFCLLTYPESTGLSTESQSVVQSTKVFKAAILHYRYRVIM